MDDELLAFLEWLQGQGYGICEWRRAQEHPLIAKRHYDLLRLDASEQLTLVERFREERER